MVNLKDISICSHGPQNVNITKIETSCFYKLGWDPGYPVKKKVITSPKIHIVNLFINVQSMRIMKKKKKKEFQVTKDENWEK